MALIVIDFYLRKLDFMGEKTIAKIERA